MSTSGDELQVPMASGLTFDPDSFQVDLSDGRSISIPLAWYPRLLHALPEERSNWRFIGRGEGIHWPDLDEDISVESLIRGDRSSENPASLQRWLAGRGK